MSRFRYRVLLVVLLAAVAAGLAAASSRQAARAASLEGGAAPGGHARGPLVTALPGRLFGVSAVSAADAWAVGNDCSTGPCTTLTLHWNGTAWSKVASPSPGGGGDDILNAVHALSATSAWAVGDYCTTNDCSVIDTLILHWNGTAWSQVNSPDPASPIALLNGVIATSPTSAWAVGDYLSTASGQYQTLILRWNGGAWSQASSPNPNSPINQLDGVAASSRASGWAAGSYATSTIGGYNTLILHWNGTSWSRASSPNPSRAGGNFLSAVAATSPASAWAVGEYCASHCGPGEVFHTLILHWNGASWSAVNSPSPSSTGRAFLEAVAATSASNAWAVGTYPDASNVQHTLILHWNGTKWLQA